MHNLTSSCQSCHTKSICPAEVFVPNIAPMKVIAIIHLASWVGRSIRSCLGATKGTLGLRLQGSGVPKTVAICLVLLLSVAGEVVFSQQAEEKNLSRSGKIEWVELSDYQRVKAHEEMLRDWGMPMTRRDVVVELNNNLAKLSKSERVALVDHEMKKRGFHLDVALKLKVEVPGYTEDAENEDELAQAWVNKASELLEKQSEFSSQDDLEDKLSANRHRIAFNEKIERKISGSVTKTEERIAAYMEAYDLEEFDLTEK